MIAVTGIIHRRFIAARGHILEPIARIQSFVSRVSSPRSSTMSYTPRPLSSASFAISRRLLVAEHRHERRDDADRLLDEPPHPVRVGRDARRRTARAARRRRCAARRCSRSSRYAMIGSNTFSCSWPASAAIVTVTSPPITSKHTWFTTSGITGFTLPGMIDEPGCIGGRLISPKPGARAGAEAAAGRCRSSRASPRTRLSTPESCTNAPVSAVASTRSGAVISSQPRDLATGARAPPPRSPAAR